MRTFQDLREGDTLYLYNTATGDRSTTEILSVERISERILITARISGTTPTEFLADPDGNIKNVYDTDDWEYEEHPTQFLAAADQEALARVGMYKEPEPQPKPTLKDRIRMLF